jgi:hypothetical protein
MGFVAGSACPKVHVRSIHVRVEARRLIIGLFVSSRMSLNLQQSSVGRVDVLFGRAECTAEKSTFVLRDCRGVTSLWPGLSG